MLLRLRAPLAGFCMLGFFLSVDGSRTHIRGFRPDIVCRVRRPQISFRSSASDSTSDLRFTYCACAVSTLLGNWSGVDRRKAAEYIERCYVSKHAHIEVMFCRQSNSVV